MAGSVAGGLVPTGTVTFLFTDVVGSTRLWQENQEAMALALARHDELLRDAITSRRGFVFSTAGDAFAAAFWTSEDAVEAASAAQTALGTQGQEAKVAIRVRMGIHTGTAAERNGDYFGPTLKRAARIMGLAHGGQVLVSDATARLLGRVDLVDLGEHELKDLEGYERIWQVGDGAFPPLPPGHPRRADLPVPHRSFVGRGDERRRLAAELRPGHVVTLIGVGGVGKTRLALEVAHDCLDAYDGRVWWCDLSAIDDPSTLDLAVATMLSVHPQVGLSPAAAIVDALRDRRALVVLDNCEQVLDEAAALVGAVVDRCPAIAMMATSREPLGLSAEAVWPVRSLDSEDEAVELFLERAHAADATFEPSEDRAVLAELCRRLDGIPLAIELAAARVRSMTPTELLAGLHDRFRLLRGGRRGGLDRHRTLAATLDWSYGLLHPHEKVLFDWLSVFPTSFDTVAVEAISSDDAEGVAVEATEVLASLVDKSIVAADRRPTGTRYRLLETVRYYAETHAIERDELELLRDRHLAHYLTVAESAFASWLNDYPRGRAAFDLEWDNLRAAAQHAHDRADSATLERLFAAIGWPATYALAHEVGEWASRATALPGAGPATCGTAATFAAMIGRFDEAEELAGVGIAAATGPRAPETWMCWTAMFQGRGRTGWTEAGYEAIVAAHQAAVGAIGPWGDAFYLAVLAAWEVRDDPAAAATRAAHASSVAAAHQNPQLSADVGYWVGLYHGMTGDPVRGLTYCRDALALTEAHDLPRSRDAARQVLAQVAMLGGLEDPTPLVREAIEAAHRERLWFDVWPTIRLLARWWAIHAMPEPAAVVVGYLDANGLASPSSGVLQQLRTDPAAQAGLAEGARLDRDQLVTHILAHLSAP